ncbi:MAG: hypothetical protein ACLFRR_10275 [Spirochaetaceae bacterium]
MSKSKRACRWCSVLLPSASPLPAAESDGRFHPGDTEELSGRKVIERGDPSFDLLAPGGVNLGVEAFFRGDRRAGPGPQPGGEEAERG